MSEKENKPLLSTYIKKWIGAIMGTVTGALLLVLLLNLGQVHTHDDTTATLAKLELAVEKRKEADVALELKVEAADIRAQNQKENQERLRAAVKRLEEKVDVLISDLGAFRLQMIKFFERK